MSYERPKLNLASSSSCEKRGQIVVFMILWSIRLGGILASRPESRFSRAESLTVIFFVKIRWFLIL